MQPNCPSCIKCPSCINYPSWIKSTKPSTWTCAATFHYKLKVVYMRPEPSRFRKSKQTVPTAGSDSLAPVPSASPPPLNPHPRPQGESLMSSYQKKVQYMPVYRWICAICWHSEKRMPTPLHLTQRWPWKAMTKGIIPLGRTSSDTSGHPLHAEGEMAWDTNLMVGCLLRDLENWWQGSLG